MKQTISRRGTNMLQTLQSLLLILTIVFASSCKKEDVSDPIITWFDPADIIVGSALSTTELNATANCEGTFVYNPALGAKLALGAAQDLKVTFTPSDLTHYNKVTKTVKINVIMLTDKDGNVYKTVTIGTQMWMAENLKTTKLSWGESIPNVTDNQAWVNRTSAAYCWGNNDIANKNTFGALYNWYAVNTRSLCPLGWHVPTNQDWETLRGYLITNSYSYDGTTNGNEYNNKIAKALASASGWSRSESVGAVGKTDYPSYRNKSGFSALPAGSRDFTTSGRFFLFSDDTYWWSATERGDLAGTWFLNANSTGFYSVNGYKKQGQSVRCIKD